MNLYYNASLATSLWSVKSISLAFLFPTNSGNLTELNASGHRLVCMKGVKKKASSEQYIKSAWEAKAAIIPTQQPCTKKYSGLFKVTN